MAESDAKLISQSEARAAGLKRFFTGRPCKWGHVSERLTSNHRCIECHNKLIGVNRESHRANFRRWYAKNAETERPKMVARRWANLERYKAVGNLWKKNNPEKRAASQRNRKARQVSAEGSHTAADIKEIRKDQRGKCAYYGHCKTKLGSKYHVDHIIPLSRGGGNGRANLQLLCVSCNCSKHARDPIQFAQSRGLLL